ncbi:hypothetical protein F5Y14DRAFT_397736 [Nemania sp. NC0429]|nr:hypothetical protein F5Y14DRAFT_397736 [Nemania sp. NC0429]
MAASSTSQCYRAVRHHLRPHYDGIWVPDSLLALAFERYTATFTTGSRFGSSVPGPMEHRKRLAKRHMGELRLGQPHAAAPIWELANLVDLTQWKWKPPVPTDARRRLDTNTSEMRAISDVVLNPLRSLFPQPTDNATDEARGLDDVLLPQYVTLSGVAETLPGRMIDAALEPLSRVTLKSTDAIPIFSRFCGGWEQALAKGLFHGQAVGTVLAGITDGLEAKSIGADSPKTTDRLKLLLMEATIDGLSKGGNRQTESFDHVAWNETLRGISKIQKNTIRVFTKAIACIPEHHLGAVSPGILENLDAFLSALGGDTEPSTLLRQTSKMATPLKRLGQSELRFIVEGAIQKVLDYTRVDGINFPLVRFSWLVLLARLPSVDMEYLAQVCIALEAGPIDQPLTEFEICRLFLVWENNQTPIKHYTGIHNVLKSRGRRSYGLLSKQLWTSRQFHHVRCFSEFLHAIGRDTAINMIAKAASCPRRKGSTILANIAVGMRKPQTAIEILYLYEKSRRYKSSFWGSRFGLDALELLTWVPGFDHKRLWRALRILPSRRLKNRCSRHQLRGLNKHQMIRMSAVGIVTGMSPHLTSRKAFSLIMDCCLNLQRHNTKLPLPFLRALIHNATRQLVEGQPGVTSRLRYVLYIINHQLGGAEARRIGMAMERRRRHNFGLE